MNSGSVRFRLVEQLRELIQDKEGRRRRRGRSIPQRAFHSGNQIQISEWLEDRTLLAAITHYPMNGDLAEANGFDGTAAPGLMPVATADRKEISSQALHFDGASQYFTAGESVPDPATSNAGFTVAAWVKADDLFYGGANRIRPIAFQHKTGGRDFVPQFLLAIDGRAGSNAATFFLASTEAIPGESVADGRTYIESSPGSISAGQWYHLAATYDAASQTMSLYINGVKVAGKIHASMPAVASSDPVTVGRTQHGDYFQGSMDDLWFYARALSAAEILELASDVNTAPSANPGGPYTVDEGGSVALDASGSTDVESSLVTYEWDFNYDGVTFNTDATGVAPIFGAAAIDGPATRTIALRVTDAGGLVSPAVTTTVQIDNVAPVISLTGDANVTEGTPYALTLGDVVDPGDDTVTEYIVHWGDGTSNTYNAGGVVTHTYADGVSPLSEQSPVVTTISVNLVDEDGVHADAGAFDVIVRNVAPAADAGGPYIVEEGDSIVLDASGSSDPGNDIVSIEWDFDYQSPNFTVDATGLAPIFNSASLPGGTTYPVAVRVTDSSGEFQIALTEVTIRAANQPPSLSLNALLTTLPEDADTANRIAVAEIVVSDDGRGTNLLSLSGADSALFEIVGTKLYMKAETVLNHEALSSLSVTVSVDDPTVGNTPDDADGLKIQITDVNEAPVVAAPLELTRTEDDAAVSVSLLAGASDPDDGDSIDVADFLVVSGNGVGISRSGSTLTMNPTDYNLLAVGESETIVCTFNVVDSHGLSVPQTMTVVVSGRNDAPGVASNGNVAANESSIVTAAGTWNDPDASDVVILSASVGTVVKSADGTWSWSWATSNGPAQSQTVIVTAQDSQGIASTTTFDLTVNNVAPSVTSKDFAVAENTPNGTVVGTLTATEPGSDTLTWQVTGGTGATAFSVNASTGVIDVLDSRQLDFETTETLTLDVVVNDGDGGTGTATVSIHIINRASITGAVFVDVDADLLYDGDETGIDGIAIDLTNEAGDILFSTVTQDGGIYLFEDVVPGTYRIHEHQPSGVDDGPEISGTIGGTVVANDTIELTVGQIDARNYNFAEQGQQLTSGDTAPTGFWQNKHGQQLIVDGGAQLAVWLTATFPNVFGNKLAGATGEEVAVFYRDSLFKQQGKKSATPPKVDAQFMAIAMSVFFTSRNLVGDIGVAYGLRVTDTGIGTSVVNVGANGRAFCVADNTDLTILQILLATNALTDMDNVRAGFTNVYDVNGDGVIDAGERELRLLAQSMFDLIISGGSV